MLFLDENILNNVLNPCDSLWQLGCIVPPLTQKSTWPIGADSPNRPAFVCITWTKFASSFVSLNISEPYRSTNGLAGSNPVRRKSE